MDEVQFPHPHFADPDIFLEALAYSEATTGFTATLVEKDYYSSLVLQYVFHSDTSLVFKEAPVLARFTQISTDSVRIWTLLSRLLQTHPDIKDVLRWPQ